MIAFLLPTLLAPLPAAAMTLNEMDHPARSTSRMAHGHAVITQRLQKTASWLDSFFGDEREAEELASSNIRFGLSSSFLELEDAEHRVFVRGRVVLPRLERRLQLVFEGRDDNNLSDTTDQEASSVLRYSIKDTEKNKLSFDAGFRGGVTDPRAFTRLRLRKTIHRTDWLTRLSPALVYDTHDGWEAYLRIDNEHEVGKDLFFRSTTRPVWADREIGISLDQNFTIFKRLSHLRYIAFDWLNHFVNHEHNKLDSSRLRVRFRRAVWQDKLFLEFAPGLLFADEHEHRLQWEGYVTLEMVFSP